MPIIGLESLDKVVRALRSGDVVGIPTDTVYGVAAMPNNAAAIRRLAALKGRPEDQPVALLIDDVGRIAPHISDPSRLEAVAHLWPGPLTVVVAVEGRFTSVVTEAGTLGIRIPDDDVASKVITGCGGALAVTSANRSTEPPATSAEEVAAIFGPELMVLDGGSRAGGRASTVLDLSGANPRLLRVGPIAAEALGEALGADLEYASDA